MMSSATKQEMSDVFDDDDFGDHDHPHADGNGDHNHDHNQAQHQPIEEVPLSSRPLTSTEAANGVRRPQRPPPRYRDDDPNPARSGFDSPITSLQVKHLATKFRAVLMMLLVLYIVLHILDSIVGAELSPIAPDMLLLFIGWYAQDLYRIQALKMYNTLSMLSLGIDVAGVCFQTFFLVAAQFSPAFIVIIWVVFLIEAVFKVTSIIHGRRMLAFLMTADRLPH